MTDPVLAARGVMPELTGDAMLDAEIIGFARGVMYRIAERVAEMLRSTAKVPWTDEMPQWWKDSVARILEEHAEDQHQEGNGAHTPHNGHNYLARKGDMVFNARMLLRPGPSAERPITLVVENPGPDEDGSRARIEMSFTLEEWEAFLRNGRQATEWVKSGAWKAGA